MARANLVGPQRRNELADEGLWKAAQGDMAPAGPVRSFHALFPFVPLPAKRPRGLCGDQLVEGHQLHERQGL